MTTPPPTGHADSPVKILLLRTAGTNCDRELAHAFALAGAAVGTIHINALLKDPARLERPQILALPGGFSYGDDIASGKILANQLIHHLKAPLRQFVADGKLILGVCNGFQVLVKSGLLPGPLPQFEGAEGGSDDPFSATLTYNVRGKFEDRWVKVRSDSAVSKWMPPGKTLRLPIAHGEGRFVTRNAAVLDALKANDQIAFRYVDDANHPAAIFPDNPNGSTEAIAGICDVTGRVLGLMPHPERIADRLTGPHWTRQPATADAADGMAIFEHAVAYVRQTQEVRI